MSRNEFIEFKNILLNRREQIWINRLKVKPHARYCVDCRGIIEQTM
jgi:hypothetical protein